MDLICFLFHSDSTKNNFTAYPTLIMMNFFEYLKLNNWLSIVGGNVQYPYTYYTYNVKKFLVNLCQQIKELSTNKEINEGTVAFLASCK